MLGTRLTQSSVTEKYLQEQYRGELKANIYNYLRSTRNEPGLSLKEVAEIMTDVFSKSEFEAIAKDFNKYKK